MKDRIKQLMSSQNMTQQNFSQMLGINPASLSQVLSGRSNPTLNHVEAIKKSFPNISYKWLLDGSGSMYETEPDKEPDLFSMSPLPTPQKPAARPSATNSKQQAEEPAEEKHRQQTAPAIQKVVVERNIKEIVIYYDNNTFETFVPKR